MEKGGVMLRLGQQGEIIAVKHLKRCGYRILERNYRNRLGEIDIVAKDRDSIVFVEVKARRSPYYGNPKSAITSQKKAKISKVALMYLKKTGQLQASARFDVVAIDYSGAQPSVELVQNAFELAYAP